MIMIMIIKIIITIIILIIAIIKVIANIAEKIFLNYFDKLITGHADEIKTRVVP